MISALVDLDLLSSEGSEEWTARLARASEDPLDRPRATPDLRREANEYIERCLAEIATEGEEGSEGHWRVYGALEAFVEVGLLTGQDFERWQEGLWRREAAGSDDHDSRNAVSRFEMTHLLRVVPGPDERVDGLRVTVLELYADGVSVQWHRAPSDHPGRHWRALSRRGGRGRKLSLLDDAPVRLADELNTDYVGRGGGSSHGRREEGELGRTDFAPAVPEHARRLLVGVGDQTLAVPL